MYYCIEECEDIFPKLRDATRRLRDAYDIRGVCLIKDELRCLAYILEVLWITSIVELERCGSFLPRTLHGFARESPSLLNLSQFWGKDVGWTSGLRCREKPQRIRPRRSVESTSTPESECLHLVHTEHCTVCRQQSRW
jgi:hypothetical protein